MGKARTGHEMLGRAMGIAKYMPKARKHKNWIAGAIKHPGALHKELGVKAGEKIPSKKLNAAAGKKGLEGKRARLAQTLKSFHHKHHKHEKHEKHRKHRKGMGMAKINQKPGLTGVSKEPKGSNYEFEKSHHKHHKTMCKTHHKAHCKIC